MESDLQEVLKRAAYVKGYRDGGEAARSLLADEIHHELKTLGLGTPEIHAAIRRITKRIPRGEQDAPERS